MGTYSANLLADFFIYSHEVYFIQGLLKINDIFFTLRFIDDVLSLNILLIVSIPSCLKQRIPYIHTTRSASYLVLHLVIDSD
jgi:hypothetical protein